MDDQWKRLVAGLVGGLVAGATMNAFARAMDSISQGQEADGAARGRSRVGRGMQPPQAAGPAEDDAAVRTGELAYRAVVGRTPPPRKRLVLGSAAHYAFSMGTGAAYGVLADRFPGLRRGFGVAYGLLVWAIADEGVVPALGLSRGPRQLPVALHAYSVAGHAVYGATLEAVRRWAAGTHRDRDEVGRWR